MWFKGVIIDLNYKVKSKRAGGQRLCDEVGIERHWSIKEGDNINNSDPIDSCYQTSIKNCHFRQLD